MFDRLRYELAHAARRLAKDRVFTAVALLSVGLGVGANAAIFSLVDQALFRRLPVRDPDRLVLLDWKGEFVGSGWGSSNLLPHPLFRDLARDNDVFDGMFARHPTSVDLAVEGGTPQPTPAEIVSGSYFRVLGVGAETGRLIEDSDDVRPGAHPVVVLSHDFWRKQFGGAPDVVGRKVLVNNHPMTVIGVAAAGFRGVDWGEVPDLWVPTMMKREATPEFDWLDNRQGRWLHVFGRLKPGLTRAQAQARLQPWFKAMLAADMKREGFPAITPDERARYLASTLEVLPAAHGRSDLRGRLQAPLLVLLCATGLVLLLACLNVANLSLARAFARRRETALRLALGATRGRIARELLLQSALLALASAAVGLLLAPTVAQGLMSFLPEGVDLSPAVNPRVFLFALAVTLLTGVAFGLVPALQAGRARPSAALKEESASVAAGLGLRKALVIGQIALALVLLIGAGLFVRTLVNLRTKGPGFATTNLLVFHVDASRAGYGAAESRNLIRHIVEAVRALPETQSAAVSTAMLLGGGSWNGPMTIDDGQRRVTGTVHRNAVGPGYFATLGVPVLAGRDFTEADTNATAPEDFDSGFRSAIVNESLARKYFGSRSPLGARLALTSGPDARADIEVVGVVKTFAYRNARETEDQVFYPFFEGGIRGGTFYVRTRVGSAPAFNAVRAAVARIDPTLPVADLRTVDDQLDRSLTNERLLADLAAAFAALAVLLAVIGLYGVTSFVVTRRTREIGIRLALGATPEKALWLVLRDTAAMVAAALAIALPAVYAAGRLIESQLYDVRATDALTLGGAVLLVSLVALASSAAPARRAASISPMQALRYE